MPDPAVEIVTCDISKLHVGTFALHSAMAKLAKEKYLVLMVDDADDDCLLIKLAMNKADRLRFIGSVSDGDEAVSYLNGTGKYADRERYPIPDMLLLDLKMPRKDGFEVLEWLQSQPFENMTVVVLSGSDQPEDVQRALGLGADYYQTKQAHPDKRRKLMELLQEYLVKGTSQTSS